MTRIVGRACWVLMLVGLSAWSDQTAGACSCIRRDHPCEVVFTSGPIFRGRVLAIDSVTRPPLPGMGQPYKMRRVTFAIAERLRGDIATPQVEVLTGMGDGDCGYAFEEGGEYLVYTQAPREGQPLATGICSWTKPASEAEADLAFLRTLQAKPETLSGRIFGTIVFEDANFDNVVRQPRLSPPRSGISVTLTRDGIARRAETNDAGAFEFVGLDAGTYELNVDLGAHYTARFPREVKLPAPQACVNVPISFAYDGR
jgi:hypothetical protein